MRGQAHDASALYPRERHGTHCAGGICPDRPQGRSGQVRKISPPPGYDPRTAQPVASCYTDYDTRPTTRVEDKISGDLDERITVKRILKNVFFRIWPNFMQLGSQRKDYVKNGNESSSSMKEREFFFLTNRERLTVPRSCFIMGSCYTKRGMIIGSNPVMGKLFFSS